MKLTEIKLYNEDECAEIADTVANLRPYWIPRPQGWTLGASAYLDDPNLYPVLAQYSNNVVVGYFHHLLAKIEAVLGEHFNLAIGHYVGTAAPSFHIFDNTSNGVHGHWHTDEPYDRIAWPSEISDPFSFTMAVALPKVGGGMGYEIVDNWPNPKSKVQEYEIGTLYIHDGKTPHRIENFGDMEEGEARITLQGHGVTIDGQIAIYF